MHPVHIGLAQEPLSRHQDFYGGHYTNTYTTEEISTGWSHHWLPVSDRKTMGYQDPNPVSLPLFGWFVFSDFLNHEYFHVEGLSYS
jgi:hypothetical protein